MATEWWRKMDIIRISVTIQLTFSWLNGEHMSVTFQSIIIFEKLRRTRLEPWTKEFKGIPVTLDDQGAVTIKGECLIGLYVSFV